MRTVRCKTWDNFTVTPNRRQHRAALWLTGSMTVAIVLASDDQTLCSDAD